MCSMMFDYRSGTTDGRQSCNVVERGIVVQGGRIGARQEALVYGLKRGHRLMCG